MGSTMILTMDKCTHKKVLEKGENFAPSHQLWFLGQVYFNDSFLLFSPLELVLP